MNTDYYTVSPEWIEYTAKALEDMASKLRSGEAWVTSIDTWEQHPVEPVQGERTVYYVRGKAARGLQVKLLNGLGEASLYMSHAPSFPEPKPKKKSTKRLDLEKAIEALQRVLEVTP